MNKVLIPKQHPSFKGHFPQFPVLPAVVLLDILEKHLAEFCVQNKAANRSIIGIKKMKFLKMIKPGDEIEVKWTLKDETANVTVSLAKETAAKGSVYTK